MNLESSELYEIFARRDKHYEALFFMAVKTTGIFCRPGCPARLPRPENCTFYDTASECLREGYRACKRCHPMAHPGEASDLVKRLINLVEDDPDKRWSEAALKAIGIDPSTARRQFKARFKMTFSDYARQRRMAYGASAIREGDKVINAQLTAGYDSPSGFRAAFAKTFGVAPKNSNLAPLLIDWLDTPLGPMMAICDDAHLFLLEFTDRKNMDRQMERLSKRQNRAIVPGRTAITDTIASELKQYFSGDLKTFQTPLKTSGTDFQKTVWQALIDIPFGQTRSYSDLAMAIGNEKAVRAVASSNANNGLAIIIPCHRVIGKNGGLGGYAGGLSRKDWLLRHERKYTA